MLLFFILCFFFVCLFCLWEWIEDIKCLKLPTRERFSAKISAPGIGLAAPPVFEERPSINPQTSGVCQILPADGADGSYQLQVTNLDACGVKSCPQDGQVTPPLPLPPSPSTISLLQFQISIDNWWLIIDDWCSVMVVSDAALAHRQRPETTRGWRHRDPLQATGSHRGPVERHRPGWFRVSFTCWKFSIFVQFSATEWHWFNQFGSFDVQSSAGSGAEIPRDV